MTDRSLGPVLYCGDPHGRFRHIFDAVARTQASAVVLLGDLEPKGPLQEELTPLIERELPVYFVHGNHDSDSDVLAERVWDGPFASQNIHCRVVTLPDGTRLAGLGGIFRESVWHPLSDAAGRGAAGFVCREDHARATPRQERWRGGPPRRHLSTIYIEELMGLFDLRADVFVTHEAPGYHPHGIALLDNFARAMGAKVTVHGHHHDRLDSSACWERQGFKSFGVGLRGITAIDIDGRAEVIVPGELDEQRSTREVK